ncbi:MAG: response regulator transcription factor, partial [Solirubrobacteraceae bacterium]
MSLEPQSQQIQARGGGHASASERVADASLNILVVDDESDLREMLTRSFSREGHRVLAVADGRAAIDRASTDSFDIVLLDVALG